MAPVVFLIHGFLGSGKTTFAKRLEKHENALRLTHDEWMSRLYGADPPDDRFEKYARRVSGVMENTWTRCVALEINVILDTGFWSHAERVRVRGKVAAAGGMPVLYRLWCPDEVAGKRIERRNRSLSGSLLITPNTFRLLSDRFEPLFPEEERIEVRSDRQGSEPP